jgi:hypothetical protein
MKKKRSLIKDNVSKLLDHLLDKVAKDGAVYSEVRDKLVKMILEGHDRPKLCDLSDDDFSARKERWIAP